MAKTQKQNRQIGASGQLPGEDLTSTTVTDRPHTPSAQAEDAVRRLARLVGRHIAREQKRTSS